MSNPKKVRNLETIVQQRAEAVGGRDVEFAWKGKHYSFPHPQFVADDWQDAFAAAKTQRDNGVALLGEEKYEQFHADGGQASFLLVLYQEVAQEAVGVMSDGTPTQSSTS